MKELVVAFDLDHTLVDASHRGRRDENGEWDLEYWIENSILEHIMKDKLLPLVDVYRELKKTNHTLILVTARELKEDDYIFLKHNNLEFDFYLERKNSKELDEVLKDKLLKEFFEENGLIPYMAFDDKEENLEVFDSYGFRTFNAIYMNEKLRKGKFEKDFKPKHCIKRFSAKEDLDRENLIYLHIKRNKELEKATKICFERYLNFDLSEDERALILEGIKGEYPIDKLNRWLGYIQGNLISRGLTTVDKEREFTRPIFREAYDKLGLEVKSFSV